MDSFGQTKKTFFSFEIQTCSGKKLYCWLSEHIKDFLEINFILTFHSFFTDKNNKRWSFGGTCPSTRLRLGKRSRFARHKKSVFWRTSFCCGGGLQNSVLSDGFPLLLIFYLSLSFFFSENDAVWCTFGTAIHGLSLFSFTKHCIFN